MSDRISHECGLAVVRLLKPLDWYREAHGDSLWGLRRLFLLMEKQHNRGQDGAGIGAVRFDMPDHCSDCYRRIPAATGAASDDT